MCTRIDWRNKKQDFESNGNLIKTEIREQIYRNEYYPSIDDIAAKNWIPNNLQKLLRVWIQSEVKVQSIGQAIIKSSTRTALTPILFGLGVELDHVFVSNSSLWDASVRLKTEDVQHQFALVASTDWNVFHLVVYVYEENHVKIMM